MSQHRENSNQPDPLSVAHFSHMAEGSHSFFLILFMLLFWMCHLGQKGQEKNESPCGLPWRLVLIPYLGWEIKAWNPLVWGGPGTIRSQGCTFTISLLGKKWKESLLHALLLLFWFSMALFIQRALMLKCFCCITWVKVTEGWRFSATSCPHWNHFLPVSSRQFLA